MTARYSPHPWHRAEFVREGETAYIRIGQPGERPHAVIHLTAEMLNGYERCDFLKSLATATLNAQEALTHDSRRSAGD